MSRLYRLFEPRLQYGFRASAVDLKFLSS